MNSLRLLRLYWRLKKPLAVYYVMTLPVVRLARHRPIRGNLFAQSTFVILKVLPRQFAKIMPSVPFVPECARRRNYAKAVVHVPVLILPLISVAYSVLLLILNNKLGWKFISPVLKRSAKSRLLARVLPDCRPV